MQQTDLEKEFEKHIRDHELLIHKVCRMYAFTLPDKEDLFQEIVIQLWRSYQKFKGNSSLSTWMYRVALNTAITGLRKKRNFITSYEPSELPVTISDEYIGQKADDQLHEMYIAIEKLNQIEKAIVMLYLEDQSYEEMQDILGINEGTLRVKMTRIKEKLRQLTKHN